MPDKVIVSFAAFGREDYPIAQLRMIKSCIDAGWDGDYLCRTLNQDLKQIDGVYLKHGYSPNGRTHQEVPYAFKPDIINEAKKLGYLQVVWLDSTMLMRRQIDVLLNHAHVHGVCAFHNVGHPVWKYISDKALFRLGFGHHELNEQVKQIMACCVIFDFSSEMGKQVFHEWYLASFDGISFQNNGSARPGFVAHRHDQAVLSVLLWKYNIPLLPYGDLVYHPNEREYTQAYLVNKGI